MAHPYTERFVTSPDGLTLYARDHGDVAGNLVPVVCLPGLTRNAKDFETVAPRLAARRRVICPDFRGRGRSDRAADPFTYRPDVELADTLHLLDTLGVRRFAIIGTSRGGIVAMVMASRALDRMAGVCFNDIGPRIDKDGLIRISGYLGHDPQFAGWPDAVAAIKATNPGFPTLTEAEWDAFARRVFRDDGGTPRSDYDPQLVRTFPAVADIEAGKVPELWSLFDLMADVPSVVLRGANSDLLSDTTVAEMHAHHRNLVSVTVADRGHVPFLDEPECVAAIDQWLARIDAAN